MNLNQQKAENIRVENIVINPDGNEIASKSVGMIEAGKSKEMELTIPLFNPQKWDIENPVLYKIKTVVFQDNKIVDEYYSNFGLRTIRFTSNIGFYLNDSRIQLKGVNLHHDHGPLGAAFNTLAMERQIEIMKSMGCNAIRTSHNIPAPEFLELCDKMGILVINELFD